jgi:signal transduction histidine kinase/putative methionine-R-sulfoxide reductase with GAF domain
MDKQPRTRIGGGRLAIRRIYSHERVPSTGPRFNVNRERDGNVAEAPPSSDSIKPHKKGRHERRAGREIHGGDIDLRPVFERSPVAQAILDGALHFVLISDRFARLVELEATTLVGTDLERVLPALHQLVAPALKAARSRPDPAIAIDLSDAPSDDPLLLRLGSVALSPVPAASGQLAGWQLVLVERDDQAPVDAGRVADVRRSAESVRDAEESAAIVDRLLGISDVALAHLDLNDLLRELLQRVRDELGVDEAGILLSDPDGSTLTLRVWLTLTSLESRTIRVAVGDGFSGRIAATKQPLVLDDATTFAFTHREMLQGGVQSLMGVPLMIGERVLGVVHVGKTAVYHFSTSDLRLLELVAARIAMAVDRANLYQAERDARDAAEQARSQHEFLAEAGEILGSSLDYQQTLRQVLEVVVPSFADICSINIVGPDGMVRQLAASSGSPELEEILEHQSQHYPVAAGECAVLQAAIDSQQSLLIRDIGPDLLLRMAEDDEQFELLRRAQLTSCMRVPLKAGGRIIGVMSFWLAASARRYDDGDVRLAEDLAHRVALAADNARHYEEARRAIGARDEFISIASHELKTPLTTVKGYVQLLGRHINAFPANAERIHRTIDQLQGQVNRFEELVDELLDVSRVQSGHIRLRREACDVRQIVVQIVDRFQQELEDGTAHRIVVDAPKPIRGRWDSARLDQVITNLIANALNYSPDGGTIRVSAHRYLYGVEVMVSDEGVGIPADERARVFQPFMRGRRASESTPGAGLGLFISNEIVLRHGGSLSFESEPSAGSVFIMQLPNHPPASAI